MLLKKGMCQYILTALSGYFFIVSYGFKDIRYESNILDLFCLCFFHELTRSVISFMLLFVYLCFMKKISSEVLSFDQFSNYASIERIPSITQKV